MSWNLHFAYYLVTGWWGEWTEATACNAACESDGVIIKVRTCEGIQNGGDECARADGTRTTIDSRDESREVPCENTEVCSPIWAPRDDWVATSSGACKYHPPPY